MSNPLTDIKIEDLIKSLKTLNKDQIQELVLSRPEVLFNTVLVLITAAIVFFSASSYQKNAASLTVEINKNEELIKAIKENKDAKKSYDDFVKSFPQGIPGYQLFDKLSDFAAQNNTEISSFSPAEEKVFDLWQLAEVKIAVSSKDYNSLVRFIRAIEDPQYAIRIDNWIGSMDQVKTDTEYPIKATISIGSVKLKNE